jgi:hypothetical protein
MRLQKTVLVLATALFSAGALACPNLAGTYTCETDEGAQTANITQEESGGVTTYDFDGMQLITDNETRAIPDDGSLKDGKIRSWCEGDALKAAATGTVLDGGEPMGDVDVTITVSTDGTTLTQTTSGTFKNAGNDYPIESTLTCKKN